MSKRRRQQTGKTSPQQQALLTALAAEHSAVFAYGLVAAFSLPARDAMIAAGTAAHRARRDATLDLLASSSVTPPPPAPAYTPPRPVVDPITAADLAVAAENATATAWRAVAEQAATAQIRGTAVEALTECAIRLANWRAIRGGGPATTAFPGQP